MRRIFAVMLITVMMLSGCGLAKNLENSGLPEIAKSRFGGDTYVPAEGQFWAQYGEDISGGSGIMGLLAICYYE